LMNGITAFHGDDGGLGDVAEVGELFAGEFVHYSEDGEFAGEGLAGGVGDGCRGRVRGGVGGVVGVGQG